MNYIMDLRKIVGTRPIIMVGACVILLDRNKKVLLQLRKDNNCWGLAGGSLELGETLEEAAKRELYEETGLKANKLELFNIYSGEQFYYKYPHGDEVYNVVCAYVCNDYKGEIKIEESESHAISFFDLTNLPPNISPPDLPIIKEFLRKGSFRKSI